MFEKNISCHLCVPIVDCRAPDGGISGFDIIA